jgi:hypothetical protein
MHGNLQMETGSARPRTPVIDVTGETLLAAIEIDGGHTLAGFQQGNRDVKGCGGFARAALFIAQYDDVSRGGLTLTSLHQHFVRSPLAHIFKSRATAVKRNAHARSQIAISPALMMNDSLRARRRSSLG